LKNISGTQRYYLFIFRRRFTLPLGVGHGKAFLCQVPAQGLSDWVGIFGSGN
jgi:hypothetical protein